jgi:inorganic pyrophosphatase
MNTKDFESIGPLVNIIVEIERHSNQKWEYDRINDTLFLDRVLKYPYFYPYAYGFFPNTLGNDGDELDVLLLTETPYKNYTDSKVTIEGYIVGGLMMYDEKGEDEKIFVVPKNEIYLYLSKSDSEKAQMHDDIMWFFTNYKLRENGKWSKVGSLLDVNTAVNLYNISTQNALQK